MAKTKVGGGAPKHVLEVAVAGTRKVYRIPLADSLQMSDYMKVRRISRLPEKSPEREQAEEDFFWDLACKYMGEDVVGAMALEDFAAVADAWGEANKEDGEASLGE